MELHKQIKHLRHQANLTQTQLAEKLHVTHAAISKWERGISCPDLNLLPVLARILHTDVNTLLSFQPELSEKEAIAIANRLAEFDEYEAAEAFGKEQVFLYPESDVLRFLVANTLQGKAIMAQMMERADQFYPWFEQLCESENDTIRQESIARMISFEIKQKHFDQAQTWFAKLTSAPAIDIGQIKLNLLIAKQDYEGALKACEEQLLTISNQYTAYLRQLMELYCTIQDQQKAEKILERLESFCATMGVWPFVPASCRFYFAVMNKDKEALFSSYAEMMDALACCEIIDPLLYSHLTKKEITPQFRANMKQVIQNAARKEHDLSFCKDDPRFSQYFEN